MSACSGYSSSPSVPILPMFLMFCVAALVVLSLLGTAATVQVAGPKPTPDRVGGIDIDKVVEEIRSLPDMAPGSEPVYLKSTGGLLRVYSGWEGQLFITGHDGAAGLLAAAEKIAVAVGAIVAP